jgi:hypothetical protein
VILGGLYSYFAIPAYGNVVAITAAMVGWVAFSVFFLGQVISSAHLSLFFPCSLRTRCTLPTAPLSWSPSRSTRPGTSVPVLFCFPFCLNLFSLNPADSFTTVSNYLIANSLAAVLVVAVSSVLWAFSVLTSRPGLLKSLEDYLLLLQTAFDTVLTRFEGAVPEYNVALLEKKMAQIVQLQSESEVCSSFLLELFSLICSGGCFSQRASRCCSPLRFRAAPIWSRCL